jgi:hypothetical protein
MARAAAMPAPEAPSLRPLTTTTAILVLLALPGSARPALRSVHPFELNPMHSAAVEKALIGAGRRLERPQCRRIFSDFRDGSGVLLQDRLDALSLSGPEYLSWIVFADGSRRRSCQGTDIMAVTAPGSRVVYVCGRRFLEAQQRSEAGAEVVVLHEALHTLGLGENPPDSGEITRQVAARCASR